ncbi:MAG: DUF1778 domain-containing protein [Planctomycetales bacterium]|nr:DUF1778 domain-containing protein [Planctomycetales bacterium]
MAKERSKLLGGRPPKGDKAQSTRLYVRAVDADKELLEEAAEAAGMSLSEWIRDRLLKTAKRELKQYQ